VANKLESKGLLVVVSTIALIFGLIGSVVGGIVGWTTIGGFVFGVVIGFVVGVVVGFVVGIVVGKSGSRVRFQPLHTWEDHIHLDKTNLLEAFEQFPKMRSKLEEKFNSATSETGKEATGVNISVVCEPYELSGYDSEYSNQGETGFCWAFAISDLIYHTWMQLGKVQGQVPSPKQLRGALIFIRGKDNFVLDEKGRVRETIIEKDRHGESVASVMEEVFPLLDLTLKEIQSSGGHSLIQKIKVLIRNYASDNSEKVFEELRQRKIAVLATYILPRYQSRAFKELWKRSGDIYYYDMEKTGEKYIADSTSDGHAVLIVGYKKDESKRKLMYKIKNSWGSAEKWVEVSIFNAGGLYTVELQ